MWLCDDRDAVVAPSESSPAPMDSADSADPVTSLLGESSTGGDADSGESGSKSHTTVVYVSRPEGLFPAPLPPNMPDLPEIVERFHFLGVFVAKCLQDNRLIALPLARPLLKWMCGRALGLADVPAILPGFGAFLLELQVGPHVDSVVGTS